jgi:NAD(P)-dependent dehydrogenase (short-subunit alcohol dehydrogenase family)
MAADRPVALVTGASRGIGKACAIHLARRGYDVVVGARTMHEGDGRWEGDAAVVVPGGLDTTVAAIEAEGTDGLAVRLDVLDRQSLLDAVDATMTRFGRVDCLVNNGVYQGAVQTQEFLDTDEDELRRVFEGNVLAQLTLTRAVLPHMFEQGGGTVVNMISAVAYTDPPARIGEGGWGMSHAMSKAAFSRVAPLLNIELGDRGIRVFSVDPGFVITEKTEAIGAAEQYLRHFRAATPPVIGAVVAWLAADPEADALRGQVVFAQRECKQRGLLPGWPPRPGEEKAD